MKLRLSVVLGVLLLCAGFAPLIVALAYDHPAPARTVSR